MTDNILKSQLQAWRHHLHRHPETGFEEINTAAFVAERLRNMGLEVFTGIGGTGVVANLQAGNSEAVIALRADMDALHIQESTLDREHVSCNHGKMHACGHDGHMAMVLGAAQLLSNNRDFNGTVRFVFQLAEEHGRGAKAMMADGLFERFPVNAIFGAHNMPGMPAGSFATRAGGIMASEDNFTIRIRGQGTHAARPHMGVDPLVIGAEIVMALQTVVSRNVDPSHSAVVSCTEFVTDGLRNVIPSEVIIRGDTRSYDPTIQALLEDRMRSLANGICQAHGASCEFSYTHEFAPTVNSPQFVELAVKAARRVSQQVDGNVMPMMISEDFGAFLQHVPGNFIFIGNGSNGETGATPLHNAGYDFNDDILLTGARYFAEVARLALAEAR